MDVKKLLLSVAIAGLVLSCTFDEYHRYTIRNDSSKTIRFSFNNELGTLQPGESQTHVINSWSVENHRKAPQQVTITYPENQHPRSIRIDTTVSTFVFIFEDVIPLKLEVLNFLPIPVTIRAGDYIDTTCVNNCYDCEESFRLRVEPIVPPPPDDGDDDPNGNGEPNGNGSNGDTEPVHIFTRNPVFTITELENFPIPVEWVIVPPPDPTLEGALDTMRVTIR